jgi:hypothetical protein
MKTITKTAKIRAVKRVYRLVNNDHLTLSDARLKVAREHSLHSGSTILNWERKLGIMKPVVAKTTVTNRVVNTPKPVGFQSMKADLGNVFTSIVRKDGQYTTKEAGVISQLFSNVLSTAKFELEVHKYSDKTTTKHNKVQNLLG